MGGGGGGGLFFLLRSLSFRYLETHIKFIAKIEDQNPNTSGQYSTLWKSGYIYVGHSLATKGDDWTQKVAQAF